MKTEYQVSAGEFLARHNISLKVKFVDTSCPPFCDDKKHIHGHKYRVTISRGRAHIQFSFWNSFNDALNNIQPDAYTVLSCASCDINCPSTFEGFCAEYGYDTDSRKVEKTFKLCRAQAERLQCIFDTEQIQADLATIS